MVCLILFSFKNLSYSCLPLGQWVVYSLPLSVKILSKGILNKSIFHNNGNDLVAKVNARILDYKSTDVMDIGA